ncbi:MAG TPA: hypothetical protein VMW20_07035 [Candidatus Nanoarchaeia archaeon]|nr:hypothetical protein [Candidatus Nanoarchaeia archaeon]
MVKTLRMPVILVVNIAGLILNRVSNPRHRKLMEDSLKGADIAIPIIGPLPPNKALSIPTPIHTSACWCSTSTELQHPGKEYAYSPGFYVIGTFRGYLPEIQPEIIIKNNDYLSNSKNITLLWNLKKQTQIDFWLVCSSPE